MIMNRTKIIATLGPASSNKTVLSGMIKNGMNIARLNFSHGSHADHLKNIAMVRSLNKRSRNKVKIMQDLEGYRIRIGKLTKPVELEKGAEFHLTTENIVGSRKEIPFDYEGPLAGLKHGSFIYIDDGKIILRVIQIGKHSVKVAVVADGLLQQRKGLNIPDLKLKFGALTEKDKDDVKVAIDEKLDYVAQSFVSSARDIRLLKDIVKAKHPRCAIFAKVENRKAIKNIDSIIKESDGVMVARGDLGVSVPIYKVPIIQKDIVKRCRKAKKPVIIATQMLDSMTIELIPTRAEATDVANAILDGATHMLLSGETAAGAHPVEAVAMMRKIAEYTEAAFRKEMYYVSCGYK